MENQNQDSLVLSQKKTKIKAKECVKCGRCCLRTSNIGITDNDINRFRKAGRGDLCTDEMLREWDYFGCSGLFKNEWTFKCPFVRKRRNKNEFYCRIYSVRPDVCRNFESGSKHAKAYCDCMNLK